MSLSAARHDARARGDGAFGHDGGVLAAALTLAAAGFLLSLAASPTAPGATDALAYAVRHAGYLAVGAVTFLAAAALPPVWARRACAAVFALACGLLLAVLLVGYETKGAQRWLRLGGVSLQPVEILKPALVVLMAWMLSEKMRQRRFPGLAAALALFALPAGLLLLQPDVGQTALLFLVLVSLVVLAGAPWIWGAGLAAGAGMLALSAYAIFPHVRARVGAFLSPEGGGSFQVESALDAVRSGGLFGRGPGEGVVKHHLPDAHSDFIFAVAAEEFGLFGSVGLIALYAILAWRGLARAGRVIDPFQQLAASGLFALLALQAAIHIAVNLDLAPAKGMTLPFVSYGGSSMLGSALALGLACAFVRRRPGALLYDGVETR